MRAKKASAGPSAPRKRAATGAPGGKADAGRTGTPARGSMPKPDEATREAFRDLLPADERVTVRPMFGNVAAFVNGNMFCGLFGADLFVRLAEGGRADAIAEGAGPFEPMPGRPMREYVTITGWRTDATGAAAWIQRALAYAEELPPK